MSFIWQRKDVVGCMAASGSAYLYHCCFELLWSASFQPSPRFKSKPMLNSFVEIQVARDLLGTCKTETDENRFCSFS